MHETPTTSTTTPCARTTATEEFDVHEAIALIHQHAKTSKKKKHVVALSMREGYLYGESTEALLQVLQPLAYIVGVHHIGKVGWRYCLYACRFGAWSMHLMINLKN